MKLELDKDISAGWPVWRLWLSGKLQMSEFDQVSIDDVDAGNAALDSWEDAESRATKKATKKPK